MAMAQQIPAPVSGQPHPSVAHNGSETENSQALVALAPKEQEQEAPVAFSPPVSLLPVELDVVVPVRAFRVRKLLALEPGQLIESQWGSGEDVPLATGDVQLAWCEFEVLDTQLAVRITRLA
jgi:flagellar motor switch/type III secretory pathway protein FliN